MGVVVLEKYCFDLTITYFQMGCQKSKIVLEINVFQEFEWQNWTDTSKKKWQMIFNKIDSDLKVKFRHFLTTHLKVSEYILLKTIFEKKYTPS